MKYIDKMGRYVSTKDNKKKEEYLLKVYDGVVFTVYSFKTKEARELERQRYK